MSFKLSTGNNAYPSASASISSNGTTSATIKVTASCYLDSGWVYSTGVVAKIYINGSKVATTTILGNENNYYASDGTKSVSATKSITKTTSSQSIPWYVEFWQYTDGVEQSKKQTISGSISVSAKTSYTISYNANGGSGAPSNQTKWYGTNLTLSSTKPTRTGYSFNKWNTNSGGTGTSYNSGATYTANAAVTLYAQWTANTYTVSYDANGGSGAPSNQTKTYGVDLTLSSTKPTRTNYNFLGWGTSASAITVSYATGATYSANSAITLYAVWELAYWKPKVANLRVERCTSDGTADEYGTYALVKFDWELCQLLGTNNISSITIVCNSVTTTVSASGISGSVSRVIGAGALSTDGTYDVVVTVTDSMDGSTPSTRTITTSAFTIDILAGGTGVAFGKTASTANLVDSAWNMKVTRNSSGETNFTAKRTDTGTEVFMGVGDGGTNHGLYSGTLDKWIIYADDSKTYLKDVELTEDIPSHVSGDCNSLTTTGKYYIGVSGTNKPASNLNGWLESKKYSTDYCHQIFTTYQGHTYVRLMSAGTWGSWNYVYGVDGSISKNNVLAATGWHMNANQTLTLSGKISDQPNGVVLAFSYYENKTNLDYNWFYRFVPKYHVQNHGGSGVLFNTITPKMGYIGIKYLYIYDTQIKGFSDNTYTWDGSDFDIANDKWILRYVLGV